MLPLNGFWVLMIVGDYEPSEPMVYEIYESLDLALSRLYESGDPECRHWYSKRYPGHTRLWTDPDAADGERYDLQGPYSITTPGGWTKTLAPVGAAS